MKARLEESEIAFLGEEDRQELLTQLLGKGEEGN
jgi:hypothetical protein